MAAIAQVPFEQPLREALADGSAGAGLRVGLRGGPEAYLRYMAERFTAYQRTNPMIAYLDAALLLVAEHREHGVVGALIADQRGGRSSTPFARLARRSGSGSRR